MMKAFVCTSLDLGRCVCGCLFFGNRYVKTQTVSNDFPNREVALRGASVILMVLWVLAGMVDVRYISMNVYIAAFSVNGLYRF